MDEQEQSSSGHKLGQLVGDWFQDFFVIPLLKDVATKLGLYLDHRNAKRKREVRGNKIIWRDDDGNGVDYDFVLELGGSANELGIPVAFFECFWRRGARHSKDKARDDSGKLMPMRNTYPTARFLGIVASGEFTRPARELVETRGIHLFYVPKSKVIETFTKLGMTMDYDDKAKEDVKAKISNKFASQLTDKAKQDAAQALRTIIGETAVTGYIAGVQAALSSAPVEFRILGQHQSQPVVFNSVEQVTKFLKSSKPKFDYSTPIERFTYEVVYSDATEFERELSSIEELKELHKQIARLASHMAKIRFVVK